MGITPDFLAQAKGVLEPELSQVLPEVAWEFMPDTGLVARADVLDRYDAVIALALRFPAESFAGLRRLSLIARWGVGYDRIDVAACTAGDVILAITPEAVRRPVAEGILTFVFALAKNLRALEGLCRGGRWREGMPRIWTVQGKTLGSVGAGNIAREMFRLARAVGFGRLLAYDPVVSSGPEGVELVDLETVLSESDFVTINCPLAPETRGLIGARELGMMKPTAWLINTARGPIVNYDALVEALRAGRIAGAGLDVFETEPVPAGDPLLRMENVIVTPHAIAWTQEMFRDNSLYACRNVLEVSRGQAPEHVVNREVLRQPGCQAKLARWRA
ncbi:MAG: NAD(P)-dependent oxidoreductase [Gammaproteobacteria bacterium]